MSIKLDVAPATLERLKAILRMQRDEYLPLKVIKERLLQQEAADGQGPAEPIAEPVEAAEHLAEPPTGLQMSLEEMSAATGPS